MKTSAIRKIRTLSRNASAMSGNDSEKTVGSKNACLTLSQPGELTTATPMSPTTTSVLAVATATARLPPGDAEPRMREPLLPVSALPEVRSACSREIRPLQPSHGAVRPQSVERTVHAAHERVALLEHHPEALARAALRELADDRAVVELDRHDEERRRQIDDDAVDLTRVQRRNGVVVRVVDGRALRGPDEPRDVAVARRAHLSAELVRAEASHGPDPRDRRPCVRDDCLVHEVVRVRE